MPPPDSSAGGSGTTYYSADDFPFRFNHRNADDIFAEFFGVSSPFGGMGRGGGVGSRFPNGMFGSFGEGGGGGGVHMHQGPPRKPPPIENKLLCTLEEIFKGTTKKMKITREIFDANG